MNMYYGTVSKEHTAQIAKEVVRVLGGGQNAVNLLLETAEQETKLGTFKDPTVYGAGIGLCQCDPIAFYDTRERISQRVKDEINGAFCIDVDEVHHRELAHSPILAFLWCRMHYLLRPGAIPDTVEGRAAYWKKWYNSELGRGTEEEYAANAAGVANLC